jgi:predicted nucleic acid-binding protein
MAAWNLGDGESEALSWAYANDGDYHAVVDDNAARRCAKTMGIKFLGTGGILILAKKKDLIESVTVALDKLKKAGLYISDEIVDLLKEKANEK